MPDTSEAITVLHVDDDPEFAELTAEMLSREAESFEVVTATDAAGGLELLARQEFDCIVSDYDMPGPSGIEFLETVRETHPDIPFVLYTGKGSEAVAAEAISAGVTEYLQKGTGTEQYKILANRVRNAVSARRSAAAAERNRSYLEQTLKAVPSCVVRLDNDGRFVFANDRAVEVLGLTPSALEGRVYNDPTWEIMDLDGNPIPDEELPFRRVRDSGEPLYGFRHTVKLPDGSRTVLVTNGAPLFDEAGNVDGVVFSLTDVTERLERTERIQQATGRLEALFENSPDMINIHDGDGNIIEPNPRLCEKTGYSEAELAGMKVWDLDTEIGPAEARSLWDAMDPGDCERLSGRYRRTDGTEFPVEVHLSQFRIGDEDRFAVISRDITALREARDSLEARNERLEGFAGIVAHDLRNPLNMASGRLALARQECDSDHLDAIGRGHERMEELITTVLTLAREGEMAGDRTDVGLAELARDCWRTVATDDATLETPVERTVCAYEPRLRQLVENLVRNSVEHGGERVTVTIGALADGFYVEDDGTGIPEDERDDVFGMDHSTGGQAAGLGLHIVRQVVDDHGWELSVTDGADGGARFEITDVDDAGH